MKTDGKRVKMDGKRMKTDVKRIKNEKAKVKTNNSIRNARGKKEGRKNGKDYFSCKT